jgi:2-succinyl-5-enolpyruvyl-6-hydroxy-3-cyclohexene-1-carboxylate synthase
MIEPRNISTLWGIVFARALARLGLTHAVVSPGSRSTPLAHALACEPGIVVTPVLDERSAGFFALGLAKVTRRPTLLVCTSGTAAANYLPAVVEAWHSRVPLLVATADRPPEWRDCGAGQTIRQQGLYGSHVLWEREASLPEAGEGALLAWLGLLAEAWSAAQEGPVHLNVPLSEPLAPASFQEDCEPALLSRLCELLLSCVRKMPRADPLPKIFSTASILDWAGQFERGLIIAGEAQPASHDAHAHAVLALAHALAWPVLADVLNPVRHRVANSASPVVSFYDSILRDAQAAAALRPQAIIQLGQLPTSKVLREWLGAEPLPTLLLSPGGRNLNPLHKLHVTLPYAITDFAHATSTRSMAGVGTCWQRNWRMAQDGAAARIATAFARQNEVAAPFFEGRAVRLLARHLPSDAVVFFANSMPVRDAETFWPTQNSRRRIFCNRGVNGIDGTLSTAIGVASAAAVPTVLLTGDLSLIHDSNAFLLAQEFHGSLTIVLINNNGGGIFNHLSVAQHNRHFERFWGMPQAVNISILASAYAIPCQRITSWPLFTSAISKLPQRGIRILEICSERLIDVKRRQKILTF